MPRLTPLPLFATLLACGTSDKTSEPGEAPALTYYRDIKTILDARCVACHSPGNIAPFSLQSYDDVVAFADALPASIAAGTMPPWPPDNTCRTYQHDRSLADDEKEKIDAWVQLGAPAGEPSDAPKDTTQPPTDTIDYDVVLELPLAYTPTVIPDEYRCFLLPWPKDQDSYATALRVTPGEKRLVHHVIAFKVEPDQVPEFQALDDADPDPGYLCYGGPGGTGRPAWLGAWVPGSAAEAVPEGTGLHVSPGSMIAVQMHYHTYPGAPPDRSKLELRTAPSVEREAVVMPFTNAKWVTGGTPMLIPAGEPDVMHSFEADVTDFLPVIFPQGPFSAGEPFVVHSVGLHMHTLGTRISTSVTGNNPACLLDIPRWDFNWQGNYQLSQPLTVNPGDKLHVECHWNNSPENQPLDQSGTRLPPRDVFWGEGTGDEMCLATFYITAL